MFLRAVDVSFIGVHHSSRNTANEDACLHFFPNAYSCVSVVADGHGCSRAVRAETGSQFALVAAGQCLCEFADRNSIAMRLLPTEEAIAKLKENIVALWRELVMQHFENHPLTPEERACVQPGDTPYMMYGSTVRACLHSKNLFNLFLALGDGLSVGIKPSGMPIFPIPDDDLPGEATYSLCMPDAVKYFKHAVYHGPLVLTALSTDGFSKSYLERKFMLNALLTVARATADDEYRGHLALEQLVQVCAKDGSLDDTTVALCVDPSVPFPPIREYGFANDEFTGIQEADAALSNYMQTCSIHEVPMADRMIHKLQRLLEGLNPAKGEDGEDDSKENGEETAPSAEQDGSNGDGSAADGGANADAVTANDTDVDGANAGGTNTNGSDADITNANGTNADGADAGDTTTNGTDA